MLNTLDPYTQYIEQEDQEQLQILTRGKYHGVGLLLNYRNSTVTVGEPPLLGTPAGRAGIREGDEIVRVDGVSSKEIGFNKTAARIRGPAGTEVTLTIRRNGQPDLLEIKMIRSEITVEDVRYHGFLEPSIGYIRLTRFSKNSAQEVSSAIEDMSRQSLNGLILDLRSNPCGMLESAVEVSDLFLEKDLDIVSTRGRIKKSIQEFRSGHDPLYPEKPLIVLVNRISASASEIVAGAIQDHDRGIIMGDTTFGKGLVQSVVSISPTSALKITTAKYYTPSGRCIQSRNYSSWSDTLDLDKDVLYKTDGGRPVYAGGGIAPDVYVEPEPAGDYLLDLRRKSMFFNFAVEYTNTHDIQGEGFQITDDILVAFKEYLTKKEYTYHHPMEDNLSDFIKEAETFGYGPNLTQDIENLKLSLEQFKFRLFDQNTDKIKMLLKREIASKAFGLQQGVEAELQDDPAVQRALSLLNDLNEYRSLIHHN